MIDGFFTLSQAFFTLLQTLHLRRFDGGSSSLSSSTAGQTKIRMPQEEIENAPLRSD